MFIGLLSVYTIRSFGFSLTFNSKGPTKCVYINNQPRKARSTLVNLNSNQTLFYQFTCNVNKCGGSCNTIGYSYARVVLKKY